MAAMFGLLQPLFLGCSERLFAERLEIRRFAPKETKYAPPFVVDVSDVLDEEFSCLSAAYPKQGLLFPVITKRQKASLPCRE